MEEKDKEKDSLIKDRGDKLAKMNMNALQNLSKLRKKSPEPNQKMFRSATFSNFPGHHIGIMEGTEELKKSLEKGKTKQSQSLREHKKVRIKVSESEELFKNGREKSAETSPTDHSFESKGSFEMNHGEVSADLDLADDNKEKKEVLLASVDILHLKNEIPNLKETCSDGSSKKILEEIFSNLEHLEKQEPQLFDNKTVSGGAERVCRFFIT